MRRRLFTLLSALSLLLCVATGAIWVRSCVVSDMLRWTNGHGDRCVAVTANRGKFEVAYCVELPEAVARYPSVDRPSPGFALFSERSYASELDGGPQSGERGWHFAGFAYRTYSIWVVYERKWVVPLSCVALFAASLSARCMVIWSRAWRQRRRGRCARCGYDLRATSDRCPECGTETKIPAGVADGAKRTVYASKISN